MRTLAGIGLAALLLGTAGCKEHDVGREADETTVGDEQHGDQEFQQAKKAFIDSARRRMKQIDDKIAVLRRRAGTASDDAKLRTNEAIKDLQEERAEVETSLDRARAKSRDEWHDFENSVNRGLDRLERGYNDLLEQMKTG